MSLNLPQMFLLRQRYPAARELQFDTLLQEGLERQSLTSELKPGMRVAVGVGSRGIANLFEIVTAVLDCIRNSGAEPFIVPAMGSHGGATPDGQEHLLAEFGITPASTHARFETGMDVEEIGQLGGGYPVVFSSAALKADAVVLINRIKPHTDFIGNIGSGIQKMLVIGFGKHVGASTAHRAASQLGHEFVIREAAKIVLSKVPVLFAAAILEDQRHQTHDVQVVRGDEIAKVEDALFAKSRGLLPRLPFPAIDLLIVDEIGKEISGSGMDTNVIGRGVFGYIASLQPQHKTPTHISRIFVRNLTPATNGNAIGIGLADFTTTRLVNAINRDYTYTNALTSLGLPIAKIPMYFDTDHEAIHSAISSLAFPSASDLKIARIRNTLCLDRILVSERLAADVDSTFPIEISKHPQRLEFDTRGNLPTFLSIPSENS